MTDPAAPPSRRRETTRAKLLDAAAQLFAEVGLDAASVEAICERAGFTRGAFYSNFASKDELFLELAGQVATARMEAVRARIAELECEGALGAQITDLAAIIPLVLDVSVADHVGVMLMSEIRINALRSPELAAAYLAQDAEMRTSVAQLITEIVESNQLVLRVEAADAARLMLTAWEGESVRATMAGLAYEEVAQRTNDVLALMIRLIIEAPRR
ncbi:TetR/AcrR family transcriptional regulator [Microbacterium terricola]|uniref:HTH tetR-type domain-containing protein n=1 Tax=Microbacterium terricola TaxID=344163 RepID=A0ABM8E1K2_9MICO|nr:TetR/AcrR family transcriptional regulator [Microbacterium terricola]UYK40596.1 TetR/AcrR family transcriptional regulator [Microbacterium terricola]BDV31675.1 hypothetical protein Microterr_23350 [Microbacterium terricola]